MNKKLRCRLKAYAKLTVLKEDTLIDKEITENGIYEASSEGADGYSSVVVNVRGSEDFLKKILSSPKDTLIDLGYKDAVSNREVYALRRQFTHSFESEERYNIILANSVDRVFLSGGFISYNEGSTEFPLYERDRNGVIENKYVCTDDFSIDVTCNVDTYFVFVGTKEYLTYEDVGDVSINKELERYSLNTYSENCTVVVKHGDITISEGSDVLVEGEEYTVHVYTQDDYRFDYISINEETYYESTISFICTQDTYISAIADRVQRYDYSLTKSNCVVNLYHNEEVVNPSQDALEEGKTYKLEVIGNDDTVYGSVKINNVEIAEEDLPYEFTCTSNVSVVAEYEIKGDGKINIHNNTSTVVSVLIWQDEEYSEIARINPGEEGYFDISSDYEAIMSLGQYEGQTRFRAKLSGLYEGSIYSDEALIVDSGVYVPNLLLVYSPNSDSYEFWVDHTGVHNYGCTVTISEED